MDHIKLLASKKFNVISGSVFAISTAFLFAGTVNIAPFAYEAGASVFLLLSVRFIICLISSIIFAPGVYTGGVTVGKKEGVFICLIGISFVVQAYGYMKSVQLLPVSVAVTIFYTFPIITFILEKIIILRIIKMGPILWLVCALFGVWLLVQKGVIEWGVSGVIWALVAALMQSFINIISQRLSSISGWKLVNYTSVIPAIIFLLMYYFVDKEKITLEAVLWSVLAAICFCIGLWMFYKSIHKIGSVRTASILYLEPVFTFLLGMLFFGVYLTPYQWLGVSLVTMAISATEIGERVK